MKKRLWLTYAWRDNEGDEIDFLVQELTKQGLDIRYDRAVLLAGRPLWDQLEQQIDWQNIDAWAIYVTRASLESEPCREELSYALNIALRQGRMNFPLIGIFPEHVASEFIPKAISTRLYVPLSAPTAIQDIVDGVAGIKTRQDKTLAPIATRWHQTDLGRGLEFWPRLGSFSRTFVAYGGMPEDFSGSPSLAPCVGTRNAPNFNVRNLKSPQIQNLDGYIVISADDHLAHGQSASIRLPRILLPDTKMIVGGIDASGQTLSIEVEIPKP